MLTPTPLWSMITAALVMAAPLALAPSAAAQTQERPYWGNSAPRAGDSRVDREPLDRYPAEVEPLPPPRYAAPYGGPAPRDRTGGDAYRSPRALERTEEASSYRDPNRDPLPAPGYGERYSPPSRDLASGNPASRPYDDIDDERPRDGTFSMREINRAGHGFFGSVSQGLGSAIEYAFKSQGRPNGYILGEDLGGAFVAGLRYGEGTLHTRDAGRHKVFWQGPSIGYDAGAEGSKVMVLVYNLRDPSEIYERFGGIAGSAYVVGGVGVTFQKHNHVVLAPIRAGIGLRLGANIGYLKYTRRPTWNPF